MTARDWAYKVKRQLSAAFFADVTDPMKRHEVMERAFAEAMAEARAEALEEAAKVAESGYAWAKYTGVTVALKIADAIRTLKGDK